MASRTASRPLRAVLVVDALFEFLVGAVLLLFRDDFASGLDVASGAVLLAAVVFLAAGVALLVVLAWPADFMVRWVGLLNIAAGIAVWVLVGLRWGSFETDARLLTTAIANMFLALGALQLIAVLRAR